MIDRLKLKEEKERRRNDAAKTELLHTVLRFFSFNKRDARIV